MNLFSYLIKILYLELVMMIGFYVVLLLVILIGNGFILFVVFMNKCFCIVMNILIMGLVVSDIFVGFVLIFCWLVIFMLYYEYVLII